jgi:cyclopropane fatty-acyl-phospholipid synthase-like methyltransferase
VERGASAAEGEEALSADPYRFTTIAHADMGILGPLSPATVDAMLERLPIREDGLRVLDVGCGKGEILVRALLRTGGRGFGVEPNPAFAADARERALARLGPDRVRIVESAFDTSRLERGSFDVGICTGALHAFGDWKTALEGMKHLVAAGGLALLAPVYWKRKPHADYLAAMASEESEQDLLPDTLAAAEAAGWKVLACQESTVEEWDDYEHGYAANVHRWCDKHAKDHDAARFRERIEKWFAAYEKWGRDTMGYALMLLRRK